MKSGIHAAKLFTQGNCNYMPIYEFYCPVCDVKIEEICQIGQITELICHCGEEMVKLPTFPAMIIMKGGGGGGYPSRDRKSVV